MSFQVTRPNGTKSNAIVEVINTDRYYYLITELGGGKIFEISKTKSNNNNIIIVGNLGATSNCFSHFQRIDDRMGNGAGLWRKG